LDGSRQPARRRRRRRRRRLSSDPASRRASRGGSRIGRHEPAISAFTFSGEAAVI